MVEQKNKSIADTFNSRIRTPWVWLVLAITVGLTVLFYFSQKPELVIYERHTKALSEYRLQETFVLRSMDRIRTGMGGDTVQVHAMTMTLREMAVSFAKDVDEVRNMGVKMPSYEMVNRFEKEVLGKVAGMRRYAAARTSWMENYWRVYGSISDLPVDLHDRLHMTLDSARAGFMVGVSLTETDLASMPDSVRYPLISLMSSNEELTVAWSRFNNDLAMMYSEDLIQFFRSANMNEMSLKAKIPMAFYFLSLVLMLSTFFFIFRSKQ